MFSCLLRLNIFSQTQYYTHTHTHKYICAVPVCETRSGCAETNGQWEGTQGQNQGPETPPQAVAIVQVVAEEGWAASVQCRG